MAPQLPHKISSGLSSVKQVPSGAHLALASHCTASDRLPNRVLRTANPAHY